MENVSCAAIIVAAGNSSRMKHMGNKQLLKVGGVPVLVRTLKAFGRAKTINEIIVVTHRDCIDEIKALIKEYSCEKVALITEGGSSRQESVSNGLKAVSCGDLVAVHDGARPFISPEKIDEAVLFAKDKGNAVLAIPLSDTAKEVDCDEVIVATPDRSTLRLIQTPQIFPLQTLKEAYEKAFLDSFTGTDDSSLIERLGIKVHTIWGDYNNIKITTPEDLPRGEAILKGGKQMRVGFGYDVHALKEGRKLILGGVTVPHPLGLDGHSDADVLIHALMDAILGAAALGDIGKLFPDNDASFKDIDSRILLRKVSAVLKEKGFSVGNLDVTVAAQKPKLAPYIEEMRKNISEDLALPLDLVSIKATTTERLGFEGREEGISAYAICTIL